MNAALSPLDFDEINAPVVRLAPQLAPLPQIQESGDDMDDILMFRSLDLTDLELIHTPLPPKRHDVLGTGEMPIAPSLLRRIERELRENELDTKTVFSACRGIPRNSRKFDDAYIAARVRSFARQRGPSAAPLANAGTFPDCSDVVEEIFPTLMKKTLPPRSHPMAVFQLGDLMIHFGIWVILLLGAQTWSSWRIGAFINEYVEGGRSFYMLVTLTVMISINSWVWFTRRGNLSSAFHVPGIVLFVMTLLPALALHLRDVILRLH